MATKIGLDALDRIARDMEQVWEHGPAYRGIKCREWILRGQRGEVQERLTVKPIPGGAAATHEVMHYRYGPDQPPGRVRREFVVDRAPEEARDPGPRSSRR